MLPLNIPVHLAMMVMMFLVPRCFSGLVFMTIQPILSCRPGNPGYMYRPATVLLSFLNISQTPGTSYLYVLLHTVTPSLVLLLHKISKQLEIGWCERKSSLGFCGVTAVPISLTHHDMTFLCIHYFCCMPFSNPPVVFTTSLVQLTQAHFLDFTAI